MSRTPTVSVVICFLNEERFLAEAVESVVQQTFTDWELWLVDDGSTDASREIAKQFAQQNPGRIFYIDHADHRNLGLSASRNVGIRSARGRYVAFLDADDAWFPRKLGDQAALLDRHPDAAMVIGASKYWQSWSGESEEVDVVTPIGAEHDTVVAPPQLMTRLYPLGEGACPPPSDIMVRREVLEAVGGFEASFRGPLMLYEDQAFLSKIYRSFPVYVASACWDLYRLRPDSIVATAHAGSGYWEVRLHFLTWLKRDLARTGPLPVAVHSALGHAIREARSNTNRNILKKVVRRILPAPIYNWLREQRRGSA
jgi:glycosyltransferase involved in cell wall biosynthesis